jgi:hypothetical protein
MKKLVKYKVHVCRTAYSHLDIEVEARNASDACRIAEEEAGNHSFPTENSSNYEAQSAVEASDDK